MEYLELVIRDLENRTNRAIQSLAKKIGDTTSLSPATFVVTADSVKIVDEKVPPTIKVTG